MREGVGIFLDLDVVASVAGGVLHRHIARVHVLNQDMVIMLHMTGHLCVHLFAGTKVVHVLSEGGVRCC
jgi:hypothetical protein